MKKSPINKRVTTDSWTALYLRVVEELLKSKRVASLVQLCSELGILDAQHRRFRDGTANFPLKKRAEAEQVLLTKYKIDFGEYSVKEQVISLATDANQRFQEEIDQLYAKRSQIEEEIKEYKKLWKSLPKRGKRD